MGEKGWCAVAFVVSRLDDGQVPAAMALVRRVFDEFEAPTYPPEGVAEFYGFLRPEAVRKRMAEEGMTLWGAFCGEVLVGVAATRPCDHMSLLFVDKEYHRRGVARGLFEVSLAHCERCGRSAMTVNASPYAVAAYRRLGFVETGPMQTCNGITFLPMRYPGREE